MKTFISMLRGINVSGHKRISMAELKRLYESLGFVNVRTYVQSGNVVFDSAKSDQSKLTALIEAQIKRSWGYAVSVFIRDPHDFQRLLGSNPFLKGRNEDPAKLHVTFLQHSPLKSALSSLEAPQAGPDEFVVKNQEIFLFCPEGYGRTKLSNNFFERKLDMPATTRNWNTIRALNQLAKEERL